MWENNSVCFFCCDHVIFFLFFLYWVELGRFLFCWNPLMSQNIMTSSTLYPALLFILRVPHGFYRTSEAALCYQAQTWLQDMTIPILPSKGLYRPLEIHVNILFIKNIFWTLFIMQPFTPTANFTGWICNILFFRTSIFPIFLIQINKSDQSG